MHEQKIGVVGGGLAGCACALALADSGRKVVLFEATDRLGGRVASVRPPGLDHPVDNCPHAAFRVYERFLQLMGRIGAQDGFRIQPRTLMCFLDPENEDIHRVIDSSRFTPPLHLMPSLLKFKPLKVKERTGLRRAVKALRRSDPRDAQLDGQDFLSWLEEHGQTPATIERFWTPFVLAALNVLPADASAGLAIFLFQRGLFSSRSAFDAITFTSDLSDVLHSRLVAALDKAGVEFHPSTPVRNVERVEGGFQLSSREASHLVETVVLSVEVRHAHRMLGSLAHEPHVATVRESLSQLKTSSLVGIHARHPSPLLPDGLPYLVIMDEPLIQMVIDRTGEQGHAGEHWFSVPVSFADRWHDTSDDELEEAYRRVLSKRLPTTWSEPSHVSVVRMRYATLAPHPGSTALRPSSGALGQDIILAGAWTDTGWPSTMEGAVRSGLTAAGVVLDEGYDVEEDWPGWPEAPKRGQEGWAEWV